MTNAMIREILEVIMAVVTKARMIADGRIPRKPVLSDPGPAEPRSVESPHQSPPSRYIFQHGQTLLISLFAIT
jgi:hypothetical protein